jgi:hypothetical protein
MFLKLGWVEFVNNLVSTSISQNSIVGWVEPEFCVFPFCFMIEEVMSAG